MKIFAEKFKNRYTGIVEFSKKNKALSLAVAVECILLVMFVIDSFQPRFYYDMSGKDIPIAVGYLGGGNPYIDEDISGYGFFTYGPNILLKQGVYDIIVYYETDSVFVDDLYVNTINCMGSNSVVNNIDMKYGRRYLEAGKNEEHFMLWTSKDIKDFQIATVFCGNGSLSISRIEIAESYATHTLRIFYLIVISVIVDLVILFLKRRRQKKINRKLVLVGMVLVGAAIFVSYPALSETTFHGDDIRFHLMRIEGIKDGLLDGQFPVKIQPTQMNGYGFAVSVLYGDLFLYIPAVLRIIGFSVQQSYNLFLLLLNLATAVVSYYSFKGIFKNEKCALFGAVLYLLLPYRLVNLYYRAAVGECLAMIFFPLLFYGIYRVLYGDTDEKGYSCHWIMIAVSLTGILQSHNISFILAAVLIGITCVWKVKRVLQKERFWNLFKAACSALLLNVGFLVPFLDYYLNKVCRLSEGVLTEDGIQGTGICLYQLFTVFTSGTGGIGGGTYGMIGLTIGIVCVIAIIWFVYYILVGQEGIWVQIGKFAWVFAALMICCSLRYFPWDAVERHITLFKTVQFSWRFLGPASFFGVILVMCIYMLLSEDGYCRQMYAVSMALLALLSAGFFLQFYLFEQRPVEYYTAEELPTFCSGTNTNEYVPYGTESDELEIGKVVVSSDILNVSQYEKKYLTIRAEVENMAQTEEYIEFPMFYFPGMCIDGDERLICCKGNNNVVRVIVPENYSGSFRVYFKAPFMWKVSYLITLLTAVFMAVVFKNAEKRRGKER